MVNIDWSDVEPTIVRSAINCYLCIYRHRGLAMYAKPVDLEVVERAIIDQWLVKWVHRQHDIIGVTFHMSLLFAPTCSWSILFPWYSALRLIQGSLYMGQVHNDLFWNYSWRHTSEPRSIPQQPKRAELGNLSVFSPFEAFKHAPHELCVCCPQNPAWNSEAP